MKMIKDWFSRSPHGGQLWLHKGVQVLIVRETKALVHFQPCKSFEGTYWIYGMTGIETIREFKQQSQYIGRL